MAGDQHCFQGGDDKDWKWTGVDSLGRNCEGDGGVRSRLWGFPARNVKDDSRAGLWRGDCCSDSLGGSSSVEQGGRGCGGGEGGHVCFSQDMKVRDRM